MGKRVEETNVKQKVKGKKRAIFIKFCIVTAMLISAVIIFEMAPNYRKNYVKDEINIVINNNNVTANMKQAVYIAENKTVYLSKQDMDNYFDSTITYDEKYNQIITADGTKVASMVVGEKKITINGIEQTTLNTIIEKDGTYYIPFEEFASVYNCEITYSESTNTVIIVSLNRKLVKAEAKNKLSVKYMKEVFSASMDKVGKQEKVVYISSEGDWAKVRTERGRMGYVKESDLVNFITVREQMDDINTRIDGKVNLVWDYYWATAPDRSNVTIDGVNVIAPTFFELEKLGRGAIKDKGSKAYVQWAKSKGYKVWPTVSSEGMIETASEILNDYKLRQKTIETIVDLALEYDVDGINLDFENMYKKDRNMYSRFVIELAPRLREYGKTLSVDVTAPDGGETWSECYDRNTIGKIADYIVFMAYDQNGTSSAKAGSVSGYDWVASSLDKFINREEVKPEKIILGLPLYTRLWTEKDGTVTTSSVVSIGNVNSVLPSSAQRTWDEVTKQNYVEYTQGSSVKKMWIEDQQSLKAKMSLISNNNLAGVAFWRYDFAPDSIWSVIKEELKK